MKKSKKICKKGVDITRNACYYIDTDRTKEIKKMEITTGKTNGYRYSIKHFENGSEYGIDGGRISKLWIGKDGQTFANFDRGWDIYPTTAEALEILDELVTKFN